MILPAHEKDFGKVRCIVCQNKDTSRFTVKYHKHPVTVIQCMNCGFVFIPPVFRKAIKYEKYKSPELVSEVARGNQWLKIQKNLSRFRIIRHYLKSGSLYDIGCGFGHFLLTGKQLGFEVTGVEVSRENVRFVREQLGIEIEDRDFLEVDENRHFDLMTLWDVLEHVDHADLLIAKVSRMLKPDGYIVIQVPQIGSFFARVLKEKWWAIGLDHVNYFSKRTITKLLNDNGIETRRIIPSIELKYLLLYAILPLFKRKKMTGSLSGVERQRTFNRLTKKNRWMLELMVFANNTVERAASFLHITDEMIIIGQKKR